MEIHVIVDIYNIHDKNAPDTDTVQPFFSSVYNQLTACKSLKWAGQCQWFPLGAPSTMMISQLALFQVRSQGGSLGAEEPPLK